ncbi:MAG: hypothetical protein LBG62_05955 [Candidatus Methanoplasma sp.]|jgi:hypothetical protein|nr:hypothetical protein [Candidatus Methanoplasma sp.]
MRYALEADETTPEESERYEFMSYDSLLAEIAARISCGRAGGILVRRHCCGSVARRAMSPEEAEEIRAMAGEGEGARERMEVILDNWYMGGAPSLSEDRERRIFGDGACRICDSDQ